jgi:GR25 family glycosyltransferase involved in LPS biosynthesis
MKIFVIHYAKLGYRKTHIVNQFAKCNITDYEFIEIEKDDNAIFQENYSEREISISIKHFYAYKQISENYEYGLIVEDDVLFCDDFVNVFNRYMAQLPENYDMLFLGDGCNLHIEPDVVIPNQNIYEKCLYPTSWGGDGASRCVDSYVVSKKCATQLCHYIENLSYKLNLPIDWWLNVAARDNNFTVYWGEPTIVAQRKRNRRVFSSH